MARALSSTVQYVKLVLQLAIEFSVRGCIIHHGYNSRQSSKQNPIRFLIVGCIDRKLSVFVSHRVEVSYIKLSCVLKYYSHIVTHGKTSV